MDVISACKLEDNEYYVVFYPPYGGAMPQEATLTMEDDSMIEYYRIPMFESVDKAYDHALLMSFGPDALKTQDDYEEEE